MSAEELELDELLGAYALDAVDDEERRAVEQYLMISPRARQEVAEHREVATMLAWSGMSAPDGLWDRIAEHLDTHDAPAPSGQLASVLAGTGAVAPRTGVAVDAQVRSLDAARRDRAAGRGHRGWRTAGSWIVASAAAALVAVLAVTVIGGDDIDPDPLAAAVSEARADRNSLQATLLNDQQEVGAEVVIDRNGHGFVVADALPSLPSGQTYQLWGVIGEQVISLGVLGANPAIEPFSSGGEVVSQVVITIERAGGVVSNGNPEGAFAGTLG
jgi:anti-sigma-K factor RskA